MKDWTIGKTKHGTYLSSKYSDIIIRISNHKDFSRGNIVSPYFNRLHYDLVPLTEFKSIDHILWIEDECLTDITAVHYIKQAIQEMI